MGNYRKLEQGERFGRLTVIGLDYVQSYIDKHGKEYKKEFYKCQCDCGNVKSIVKYSLTNKLTKSCGCLNRETISSIFKKHGKTKTKIYSIWGTMKDRCYRAKNKDYINYGGRGITVCDEWKKDFMSFYNWAIDNGYKEGLSIERIDVNKNYCPENCTWIPLKEQVKNKSNTVYFTYNGETQTALYWAKKYNIDVILLKSRIKKYGWSIEKALTTPVTKGGHYDVQQFNYKNESHTLKEWSEILSININTLRDRLRQGWTIEDAFTRSVTKTGRWQK